MSLFLFFIIPLDTWPFSKAFFQSIWMVSEWLLNFQLFCKTASTSQTAQIHIYSLARLTAKEISFHGENNFYPLIQSLLITTAPRRALCTHLSEKRRRRRRKFQEAVPRQVSTLTIETTSASPGSCQPSCKPAVALPIQSAPRELKGCLQVCFPACCLCRVWLTLSSVYISTGVIWRCREAITISVKGFWYLCSNQLKAETSEVLAQPSCTDKVAASLCCCLGNRNLQEVRAPTCSAKKEVAPKK